MTEFSEDLELDNIQGDTELDTNLDTEGDTPFISVIVEEYAMEEIGDNLEFLRNNSKNLDLYLAFNAYHKDGNFEEAIERFEAAVAFEREHGTAAETGPSGERIPNATLVKCLYWLAESHNKIDQHDKAVEIFETLANDFSDHYLGLAARRRLKGFKAEA